MFEKIRTHSLNISRKESLSKHEYLCLPRGNIMGWLHQAIKTSKNTIRGPLVLVLILVSFFLNPFLSNATQIAPALSNEINLPLAEEKVDFYIGKNNSVIASLTLKGGKFSHSLPVNTQEFRLIEKIDLVVVNQSFFETIWTNRPWNYPDGLNVRIVTKETDQASLGKIANFIVNYFAVNYDVSLMLVNLHLSPIEGTKLSFVGTIDFSSLPTLFENIFSYYLTETYGSIVSSFRDLLFDKSLIYGFGFSIFKNDHNQYKLVRKIIVGYTNTIYTAEGYYIFNSTLLFNQLLRADSDSEKTYVTLFIPFTADVAFVFPRPFNVAAKSTGTFEWWLKYKNIYIMDFFAILFVYNISSTVSPTFPRVSVTNSYSESLLTDDGILNMTYHIKNTGTAKAFNTTIVFPITQELNDIIATGIKDVPVLKSYVDIDEGFDSHIYVEINLGGSYVFDFSLLDIEGWYINATSLDLLRWNDGTEFILNDYVTVYTTNGLPDDLYQQILVHVVPYLDDYTIPDLYENWNAFLERLGDNLTISIQNAYQILFSSLYTNKTLFQFHSDDFVYLSTEIGDFLYTQIPELDVNETMTLNWLISDIPTQNDRFGAFVIEKVETGSETYAKFRTTATNYYDLMGYLFAINDFTGKFLSYYDNESDVFISYGGRYLYFDEHGNAYYGVSNGLNLQFADDEAIIASNLILNETTYEVGATNNFVLTLTNDGSISAHDVKINIMNVKLNFLWDPIDTIVLKTFTISEIKAGETITLNFSLRANTYLGLNSYIALISFISDYNQYPKVITNPWTQKETVWEYGGENLNLVSSTLTFGILTPPQNLIGKKRPSMPLPEFKVNTEFSFIESNRTLIVRHTVENTGLSESKVVVYKTFSDKALDYLYTASAYFIPYDDEMTNLKIYTNDVVNYKQVIYAELNMSPGDIIVVEEKYYNLPEEFTINPLIVSYYTEFQIYQTDFDVESNHKDEESYRTPYFESNILRLSKENISETKQTEFNWAEYSSILYLVFPSEPASWLPTLSPLSYYYPLLLSGMFTIIVLIVIVASKIRKEDYA